MPEPIQVDQWTTLDHKAPMGDGAGAHRPKSWVPDADRRRLAAYYTLALYRANSARAALRDQSKSDDHREYGDVATAIRRIVAGILGSDWTFVVDGADDDIAAGPKLPEPPEVPSESALDDELVRRLYDARLAAWTAHAEAAIAEYEDAVEAHPLLAARQDAIRAWSDRRQLPQAIAEAEKDNVALGDTVIALWPQAGDWPKVTVIGPDGYFPDEPDDLGEFPDRIDLAWEYLVDTDSGPEAYLRRHTWRLVDIAATRIGTTSRGEPTWLDANGEPADRPAIYGGERIDSDGTIWRDVPWSDEPTPTTCVYECRDWPLRDVDAKLRDLTGGTTVAPPTDLRIDFVPVVHVPNTPASQTMWGEAAVSHVAQIADDIATNDTDAMKASRYLSDPTIFLTGVAGEVGDVVTPGRLFKGGEAGKMTVLDLSVGLEKLLAAGDRLQDRWWQNLGIPAEALGRVDDGEGALSGVAIALRFAPFAQLVGEARMAREPKYQLVLKFAQRLAQVAGVLEPGPTPKARLQFGNFLPQNRTETVSIVTQALQAHAISTQTAVAMLVAAGLPISDAREEVERIRVENPETYESAVRLADATGSEAAAADHLGVELPDTPAGAPPVDL